MKKYFVRIKEFVKENRKERWFKYTVIIAALIIAAIAVNEWRDWQDSKEIPPPATVEEVPDEENNIGILQKIWEDSKAHFIVFGGLTIALFIVKCRNENKLKDSGGKIKRKP